MSDAPTTTGDQQVKVYAVRNWAACFENHESRKYKSLSWIAMPVKHDGKRFRRLSRHDRSTEIFGAWCLIVEAAAKMPTRGILVDDRGDRLGAEDLSDLTGFPVKSFAIALEVLTSDAIGWLELIDLPEPPGASRCLPKDTRHITQPDQTQPNSTLQNITTPNHHHKPKNTTESTNGVGIGVGDCSLGSGLNTVEGDGSKPDGLESNDSVNTLRAEQYRKLSVHDWLQKKSVIEPVCSQILNRTEITVGFLEREWADIQTDPCILDPISVLVNRLKRNTNGSDPSVKIILARIGKAGKALDAVAEVCDTVPKVIALWNDVKQDKKIKNILSVMAYRCKGGIASVEPITSKIVRQAIEQGLIKSIDGHDLSNDLVKYNTNGLYIKGELKYKESELARLDYT